MIAPLMSVATPREDGLPHEQLVLAPEGDDGHDPDEGDRERHEVRGDADEDRGEDPDAEDPPERRARREPPRPHEGGPDAPPLEHDDRGDEGEPRPEEQVEDDRREHGEDEEEDRRGPGAFHDEPGDGRAEDEAEHDEHAHDGDEDGSRHRRQPSLRAVPRLADADLAAEHRLADDVGEEAGERDRGDERAEARQVAGDEPDAAALARHEVGRLHAREPGAEGGGRHEADEGRHEGQSHRGGDVPPDRLGHGAIEVAEGQRAEGDDAGPELQAGVAGSAGGLRGVPRSRNGIPRARRGMVPGRWRAAAYPGERRPVRAGRRRTPGAGPGGRGAQGARRVAPDARGAAWIPVRPTAAHPCCTP